MNYRNWLGSTKKVARLAPVLVASLSIGMLAPKAEAVSLVPQQEGEVNVGFSSCLGTGCSYISGNSFFSSVESLVDSSTGTRSRLFVDRAGTANTYGGVKFSSKDLGTTEDMMNQFWFRPVAMAANGINALVEGGQLEVGTFKFTFAQVMQDLTINWFDTEYKNGTSYLVEYADGSKGTGVIAAGANNNIQLTTLSNVSAITLNLGQRHGGTGDGVNFQMSGEPTDVPEPGLAIGLGAVAVAGILARRKAQATQA